MNHRLLDVVVVLAALSLWGCSVDKPGAKCDGFFANGCDKPLECVNDGEKKVCLKQCVTTLACKDPVGCCDPGYQCTPMSMGVTKNGASTGISAGTYKYCTAKP
jgi:hypothetical protein